MISKEAKRLYDIEYRKKNREKLCQQKKIYTEKTKERKRKYDKKYNKKNKKIKKIKSKAYYLQNKEIIKQKTRNYWNNNKDICKERQKEYYNKNKGSICKKQKIYYKKTIVQRNKYIKQYKSNRQKTDIKFKMSCYLRTRIYIAIKGQTKSLSTMFLIGCDIDYLMYHLQCQFKEGMTWDNYGKWHIDHIKPCASFDLSKHEEQLKCFHYSNLQPLWAKENLHKWKNTTEINNEKSTTN
jgi:hypothetical protein